MVVFVSGTLSCLWDDLGFTVEHYVDFSAREIEDKLNCFANSDHNDTDCFVCCFLAHGTLGSLSAADGKSLELYEDIVAKFFASKCPGLHGKPKMFFFQCCRESHLTSANDVAILIGRFVDNINRT